MGILKEAMEQDLDVGYFPPKVHCTVFDDNSGALELKRLQKICPRTKHINQSFLHFCKHVERQDVIIEAMPTEHQIVDLLKMLLAEPAFTCHCKAIMAWYRGDMSANGRECENTPESV